MTLFRELELNVQRTLDVGISLIVSKCNDFENFLLTNASRLDKEIQEMLHQTTLISDDNSYAIEYASFLRTLQNSTNLKLTSILNHLHALKVECAESTETAVNQLNNLVATNELIRMRPCVSNHAELDTERSRIRGLRTAIQNMKDGFLAAYKQIHNWMINFHKEVNCFRQDLVSETARFRVAKHQFQQRIKDVDREMRKELKEWKAKQENVSFETPVKVSVNIKPVELPDVSYSAELEDLKQELRKERDRVSDSHAKERIKYVELFKEAHDKIAFAARETTELSKELFLARQRHADEILALESEFGTELQTMRDLVHEQKLTTSDVIKAREELTQLVIQRRQLLRELDIDELEEARFNTDFDHAKLNSRRKIDHLAHELVSEYKATEMNIRHRSEQALRSIEAEFAMRDPLSEYQRKHRDMSQSLEKIELEIEALTSSTAENNLEKLKQQRDQLVEKHMLERKEIVMKWKAEMKSEEQRHKRTTKYHHSTKKYSVFDEEIYLLQEELKDLQAEICYTPPMEDQSPEIEVLKKKLELETQIHNEIMEISKNENQKVIVAEKLRIRDEMDHFQRYLDNERNSIASGVLQLSSPNRRDRLIYLMTESHANAKKTLIQNFETARASIMKQIEELELHNRDGTNLEIANLKKQLAMAKNDIRYEAEKTVRLRNLDEIKRSVKMDSKRIEILEFKAQLLSKQLTPLMEELNSLRKRQDIPRMGGKSVCAVKKPVTRAQSQLKNPSAKNIVVSRCHSRVGKHI